MNENKVEQKAYLKCCSCKHYLEEAVLVGKMVSDERDVHGCLDPECLAAKDFPMYEYASVSGSVEAAKVIGEGLKGLEGSAKTSTHYQVGSKQPIEIMQEIMTPEEFQGFCRGNVIKYSLRLGHKDAAVKEAAKIEQYSKWLRMSLEGKTIKPMED